MNSWGTLFLIKAKFGSSRVVRTVSEYLSGSKKIWLQKYRFALRNNGKMPILRPRQKRYWRPVCGFLYVPGLDWLDPLETELRHIGLAWRVQSRRRWAQ